jgi:hypothetical protein
LRRLGRIADCTAGILFIATPHQGSSVAQWGSMIASILSIVKKTNKSLLDSLKRDDPELINIHNRFCQFSRGREELGRAVRVACLYETQDMPVGGRVSIKFLLRISRDTNVVIKTIVSQLHIPWRNCPEVWLLAYVQTTAELQSFRAAQLTATPRLSGSSYGGQTLSNW